jgi:hypothetical protein
MRCVLRLAVALAIPALAACDSASRFTGIGQQPARPAAITPLPPPVSPSPVAPVATRPLPPPGGEQRPAPIDDFIDEGPTTAPGLSPNAPGDLAQRPALPDGPVSPDAVDGLAPPDGATRRPEPTQPPQPAAAPTTSRVVGGWRLAEQSGSSCRLTLSSAPFVDLSRASTSGCSPALAKVNAWKLENDEIVLFETGGSVAARLRQGGGGFNGAAVKTGAPISIAR